MSGVQQGLGINESRTIASVEEFEFEPIKGYPMLQWHGKRPFRSTRFYPAQLKEVYGLEVEEWGNKIYWGDNLQVMSHLLREYRGQVDLVYIDPPFDSKAEYKKVVSLRGHLTTNDHSAFEEKQYTDIWINDEYLQFMYERLFLMRELMSAAASIYLHCDYRRSHMLKLMMDEILGPDNFQNEIIWVRTNAHNMRAKGYVKSNDHILFFTKSANFTFNEQFADYSEAQIKRYKKGDDGRFYKAENLTFSTVNPDRQFEWRGTRPPANRSWGASYEQLEKWWEEGKILTKKDGTPRLDGLKVYLEEAKGNPLGTNWDDVGRIGNTSGERLDYPTQKPEELLERIIRTSSNPGDLVFDCFMGSGTTQAVAVKLGRRFIGADINLGAVQITTKRLLQVAEDLAIAQSNTQNPQQAAISYREADDDGSLDGDDADAVTPPEPTVFYTGFEVYNVNYYDVFRNPVQAKELLLQALEVQPLSPGSVFDGIKDGRMVKVMAVNRIATRADLNDLLANIDHKAMDRLYQENPNRVVERITLICMGHEPDLAAYLKQELHPYKVDVEVVDVLRDRQDLQFKRDSEARMKVKGGELVIEAFYPMNLLQKLSMQKEAVEDWRELVESVMIDWNYDGAVLTPALVDIPERNEMVSGTYKVPDDAGTIRVKITDLLSESWEGIVTYG